jgi:hypothetical protein
MAAAATALFSSTEAAEAAAACAATSEAVEFMWATEAAEAAEATAVTMVVGKMAALFVLGSDQGNLLRGIDNCSSAQWKTIVHFHYWSRL